MTKKAGGIFETWALLYRVFHPYKWQIALTGALGFLSSIFAGVGISAVVPLLTFMVDKEGQSSGGFTQYFVKIFGILHLPYSVISVLLLIIALFLLKAASLHLSNYINARIEYNYRMRMIRRVFFDILSARWPFLLKQKAGFMYSILMQDVEKGAALHSALSRFTLSVISTTTFLLFAVFISTRITILTAVGGAVLILVLWPLIRKARAVGADFAARSKEASQFLAEHLGGFKSIKAAAVEKEVFAEGERVFEKWRRAELRAAILGFLNRGSLEPLSILFIAYVFAFSYDTPGFSIQVFAATIFLVQRIFVYLEGVQSSLHTINSTIPHVVHLDAFLESLKREEEKVSGKRPFKFSRDLSFTGVGFSYIPDSLVFRDLTFTLRKGEMVGLIGSSGAGKTSIADLLMRLFEPQEGKILLDGAEASGFAKGEWRDRVGYVSQDIFLLNDTIEANIKFYNPRVSVEEMIEAAKQANIYDFIMGLKDGFKTFVGDRGIMLSGGQRQRVVLARVLARHPEILILDEATSSLDNESEVLIQKSIQRLRGKITVFIIAHRLSTVMDADRLLVLDKGKIMEEGRPRELLENPGSYFYRMHHLKGGHLV